MSTCLRSTPTRVPLQGGRERGHTMSSTAGPSRSVRSRAASCAEKICVIGRRLCRRSGGVSGGVDDLESATSHTGSRAPLGEAHLIMRGTGPIDQASERRLGQAAIGTTKPGYRPCLCRKAARLGYPVQDLSSRRSFGRRSRSRSRRERLALSASMVFGPLDLGGDRGQLDRSRSEFGRMCRTRRSS